MVELLADDPERTGRSRSERRSDYWRDEMPADEGERAREVLEALRVYRAAERAMRRRTRDEMSMGENELLALRYLFRAPDHAARPAALATYLGVSPAAVTVIIDRLERSGHLRRTTDPSDPSITLVRTTEHADADVRHTLSSMHRLMYAVASGMDAEAQQHVRDFLRAMADAVDGVAPAGDGAPADDAATAERPVDSAV